MRIFPIFIEKQDFGNGVQLNYGWAEGMGVGKGYGYLSGSGISYNNRIYGTNKDKNWGNANFGYPTGLIQYWK